MASLLPGLNLLWLEPQSDFLLGGLDGIGTVADVSADVLQKTLHVSGVQCRGIGGGREETTYNSVVTTNGTWARSSWVGGTEEDTASLDGITTFPDHGADWAGTHVYYSILSALFQIMPQVYDISYR